MRADINTATERGDAIAGTSEVNGSAASAGGVLPRSSQAAEPRHLGQGETGFAGAPRFVQKFRKQ